jgi:hypothetical protein
MTGKTAATPCSTTGRQSRCTFQRSLGATRTRQSSGIRRPSATSAGVTWAGWVVRALQACLAAAEVQAQVRRCSCQLLHHQQEQC